MNVKRFSSVRSARSYSTTPGNPRRPILGCHSRPSKLHNNKHRRERSDRQSKAHPPTYTSDPAPQTCAGDKSWETRLRPMTPDSFTCRECGRTTHRDNYQWRDEPLYRNLMKLKLCEECYRNGNHRYRTRNKPHNILHQGPTRTDPDTPTD